MYTKKHVVITVLMLSIFFSCSQDEVLVAPQQKTEIKAKALQKGPTSKFQYSIPTITPCGYGFRVDIQFFGVPAVPTFEYQIENGLGVVVDAGFVGDGQNTNWVLNPCQSYTFKYWAFGYGSPAGGNPPTTVLTATSDGCGGVFVC